MYTAATFCGFSFCVVEGDGRGATGDVLQLGLVGASLSATYAIYFNTSLKLNKK